jgi:thiamine-monophosphate kinase
MQIERLGEFGLIHRIEKKFRTNNSSIIMGMGDDAAVINPSRGKFLLFSTDTLREDIHFRKDYSSFYDIGWKSVAVSISDIAAMGGTPRYLLLSLAIPGKTSVKDLDNLLKGIKDISERYNVSLIGGNVSRANSGITIDTTVIGEVTKKGGVKRSGALTGDLIYVTGSVGGSAIGMELLKGSVKNACSKSVISNHLRPVPRVKEGQIIRTHRLATAMIDISDGLLSDLGHVCEQSMVGACIYSNLIPLPEVPDSLKKWLAKDPLFYALYGGEDYELLVTVRKRNRDRLEDIFEREGLKITYIGEVASKDTGISIIDEKGKKKKVNPAGYDHFTRQRRKTC